jgi:signal transduction histidine kinase
MLQDTTLDLLKYSPFPALAAGLRARSEAILSRWQQVVQNKLPSADELTTGQLRDDLPQILSEMADILESDDGSAMPELKAAAQGHGDSRFHNSYSISDVIIEYGLLRPIVIDEIRECLDREMTVEEVAALNMGIDTALRRSVIRFVTHQQNQLRAGSTAQNKYLSFLAHDLRGGLNSVLLTAELLKRQFAGEPRFAESIQDIDSMRQAILDTVATMDRFLHAERFRQEKVQPSFSTVDISALANGLLPYFAHSLQQKQVKLKIDVPGHLSAVTDKDLLWLILQNLVSNAIKYTPGGAVQISAAAGEQDHGPSISVMDQGPGIAPDRLENLFNAFTRGETHGEPGVGLGLYIVRQAVDVIGGKLVVESEPGKGSTFHLQLPLN